MGKKKTGLITDEVRELINEVARETASMAYIDGMGGEVNYFRAMESLLFNYKKLAALVADYEAYTHVELQGRSASISSYSPSSGYTYRTEEDILDEMKRDKIISYHRTRARFEEIDRVVKLFAERKEFHVIRMYYFGEDAQGNERPAGAEPYTWEAIAAELEGMGLIRDAKSARRWRNKIVNDSAEMSVEVTEAILYADDGADEVVKEFVSGELTLNVNDLMPADLAAILGQTQDDDQVVYAGENDDPPYMAIGFRAKKANGMYKYIWLYKVKFAIPSESYQTKGDIRL